MRMRVDMLGNDDIFTGYRTGLAGGYAYAPFLGDDASDMTYAADEAKKSRQLVGFQTVVDTLPSIISSIGDTLNPSETPATNPATYGSGGLTPGTNTNTNNGKTSSNTDYTPWIIGGIAAVVLLGGTGILMRGRGGRRRRRR